MTVGANALLQATMPGSFSAHSGGWDRNLPSSGAWTGNTPSATPFQGQLFDRQPTVVKAATRVALQENDPLYMKERITRMNDGALARAADARRLKEHSLRTSTTVPGNYEVGRSSMEQHCKPTRHFKHHVGLAERGVVHPHMACMDRTQIGDPGAYHPYAGSEMFDKACFNLNRNRKGFNSSSVRELHLKTYGDAVPGPGAYNQEQRAGNVKHIDANESVFRSKSLQRLSSGDESGGGSGPGTYEPNMSSIYAYIRNSGASMRSTAAQQRLPPDASGHPDCVSCDKNVNVGPGSYDVDYGSVAAQLRASLRRQSKTKPDFGTAAPQRALPFEYSRTSSSPDCGAYQPTVWTGRKVGTSVRSKTITEQSKPMSKKRGATRAAAPSGALSARV